MTATDSIRTEFLRDICEHPNDDTPRLIFADWLEDHGEPERAEFIRVQMVLFNLGGECNRTGHACECCAELKKRERFWLETNRAILQSRCKLSVVGLLRQAPMDTRFPELYFSRGFVSSISLTLADFMQHAAALFREHPITEVTLTDRKPYVSGFSGLGVATWYDACGERGGIDPSSSDLPTNLFLALSGEDRFNEGNGIKYYDSLDPALAAISLACVTYGRSLVGLPPLKGGDK